MSSQDLPKLASATSVRREIVTDVLSLFMTDDRYEWTNPRRHGNTVRFEHRGRVVTVTVSVAQRPYVEKTTP